MCVYISFLFDGLWGNLFRSVQKGDIIIITSENKSKLLDDEIRKYMYK